MRLLLVTILVTTGLLGACASPLPVYPSMSDAEALELIAKRQAMVRTISAECDLDLTDAQGQRVSLDGVLVAELPGRVRLRAWKFGHAVFDLTLVDDKGWFVAPEDDRRSFDIGALPARQVREAMDLLGPGFFQTAQLSGDESKKLVVYGPALGRERIDCEIDRLTLTPRRFVARMDSGEEASELVLDQYIVAKPVVWPQRMRLRGSTGEVTIRFRGLELNGEIPAGAFVPPLRAKALP